jgi:hypothetical protein
VQSPSVSPSPTSSAAPSAADLPATEPSAMTAHNTTAAPLFLPSGAEPAAGMAPAASLGAAPPAAAPAASSIPYPQPPVPEELPLYENGHPDATVMPHIDEVYKCFKEHGNGLLFRLVDKANRRWAFYNDTTNIVASVKVEFHPKAQIERLGRTEALADPETGGVVFTLRVEPLETAVFVQGDVDVFTTKFTAEHIQT